MQLEGGVVDERGLLLEVPGESSEAVIHLGGSCCSSSSRESKRTGRTIAVPVGGEGERETEVRSKLGTRENAIFNSKEQKVIIIESTFEQDIVSRLFSPFFPRHFEVHLKSLSVESKRSWWIRSIAFKDPLFPRNKMRENCRCFSERKTSSIVVTT